MFKKTILYMLVLGAFGFGTFTTKVSAQETQLLSYNAPEDFLRSFVNEILNFVSYKDLSAEELEKKLIMSSQKYFDFKRISKVVLSRHYKSFSPAQFDEFVNYFTTLAAKQLVALLKKEGTDLSEVSIKDFQVIESVEKKGHVRYKAKTDVILNPGAPELTILVRVLEKQSDNTYQIVDIVIANVSLILNSRNIYGDMLSKVGGDVDQFLADLKK
ncbi:MAG: ABC transporter substrate-binding protein [Bdellovibrionales bacterium]